MANSVDPAANSVDRSRSRVWSRYTLFAKAYLSIYSGWLRYTQILLFIIIIMNIVFYALAII